MRILQKLLNSSRIVEYIVVDPQGVIRSANDAFCRHVSNPAVPGQLIYRFLPEDDAHMVGEWLRHEAPADSVLLNFVGSNQFPYTLRCFVEKENGLLHLAGEPDHIGEGQTTEYLMSINNEMAVLRREQLRQQRRKGLEIE